MSNYTADTNNCGIVTILPMGVQCFTDDTSTPTASDGSMGIYITGGTSPYSVSWSNGQKNVNILTGVTVGTYTATVIDYYGDYTATTTCTVAGTPVTPTPTPTPSPTPTPLPTYPSNMCMTLNVSPYTQYDFDYEGIFNGKPRWSGTSFNMVYDSTDIRWEISGWTGNGEITKNTNVNIPTGTWNQLGTDYTWDVQTGACTTLPLYITLNKTDETCQGLSNGTLTVTANTGVAPYNYSINGAPYQPSNYFSGLTSGNGYVTVQDTNGLTSTQNYTIVAGPPNTTYDVIFTSTLNKTSNSKEIQAGIYTWSATTTSPIPAGVTVTANIKFQVTYADYYYNGRHTTFTSGSTVSTTNAVLNSTIKTSNYSQSQRVCGNLPTNGVDTTIYYKTYNVTFSSGGVISGTETISLENPIPANNITNCPVMGDINIARIFAGNVTINGTTCGTPGSVSGNFPLGGYAPYHFEFHTYELGVL